MEYKRNCPICGKELFYKSKGSYDMSTKTNTNCKSCSIKKLYELDPSKNKGSNNGRTGKKTIDVFINKYGFEEGTSRYEKFCKKLGDHGFKCGEDNPSFGIIQNNTGWSYKGWYKDLFFRSSLELLFIMDFEEKNNRLVLSAEGTFRIKYENGSKTYCPDFFDPMTNTIFEIKSEKFLSENVKKFTAAEEFVKNNNLKFKIITDHDLNYVESSIVWLIKRLHESETIKLTDISISKLYSRLEKISIAVKKSKLKKRKKNYE